MVNSYYDEERSLPFWQRISAINFVLFGLLGIAAYATFEGLRAFITADGTEIELLPLLMIIVICGLLTSLMFIMLEQVRRGGRPWKRILAGFLYGLLFLWSVGFGYGFWWSKIAGPEETKATLEQDVGGLNNKMDAALARLSDVKSAIDEAVNRGTLQRDRERGSGSTCGVGSMPGAGPLMRRRDDINAELTTLGQSVETTWLGPIRADLGGTGGSTGGGGLRQDLADTLKRAPTMSQANRRDAFQKVWDRAGGLARRLENSSQSTGARYAAEMRTLASELRDPDRSKTTFCLDSDLATSLDKAAAQAATPITLPIGEFQFNEGAQATAHAVRQLWARLFNWVSGVFSFAPGGNLPAPGASPPPVTDVLSILQERPEPIKRNDIVALVAAIGVDFGIFVLTLIRPGQPLPWLEEANTLTMRSRRRLWRRIFNRIEPRRAEDLNTRNLDVARFLETCIVRANGRYYLASPDTGFNWHDPLLQRYSRVVFNLVIGLQDALRRPSRFGLAALKERARANLGSIQLEENQALLGEHLAALDVEMFEIDFRSLDEIVMTARERVDGLSFETAEFGRQGRQPDPAAPGRAGPRQTEPNPPRGWRQPRPEPPPPEPPPGAGDAPAGNRAGEAPNDGARPEAPGPREGNPEPRPDINSVFGTRPEEPAPPPPPPPPENADAPRGQTGGRFFDRIFGQPNPPPPPPPDEDYSNQGRLDADDVREELRDEVGRVGEMFDSEAHVVVGREASNSVAAGHVLRVLSPGQRDGGRITQRARVVLSLGRVQEGGST